MSKRLLALAVAAALVLVALPRGKPLTDQAGPQAAQFAESFNDVGVVHAQVPQVSGMESVLPIAGGDVVKTISAVQVLTFDTGPPMILIGSDLHLVVSNSYTYMTVNARVHRPPFVSRFASRVLRS